MTVQELLTAGALAYQTGLPSAPPSEWDSKDKAVWTIGFLDARQSALTQALEAVTDAYASLLKSDYETRNNPDPASQDPDILRARQVLATHR